MTNEEFKEIRNNIKAYDQVCKRYEKNHGEIFNSVEQSRIQEYISKAVDAIETDSIDKSALDYGCGSGNLTKYLTETGISTTAVDVSGKFVEEIKKKYGSIQSFRAFKINGYDLSDFDDNYFDLIATYSVLHHVPDYLKIVNEMARALKPGGVIYIDHEVTDSYWKNDETYNEFIKKANVGKPGIEIWKYFKPLKYINKIKSILNPKFCAEGDIHVWPDDHIEWNKIIALLEDKKFKKILHEEYLLFRNHYSISAYNEYKDICSDMGVLIMRKPSE